jgi:Lrp/AsnC family leucine-responsive transcriptional regulator
MDRIDDIDARILSLLQEHGRMKRSRIAEEVGLSLPSVSDRIRKLEERGVITGYHATVDAKRLHIDITAIIRVMVDSSARYGEFVENAMALDEVLEVHSVTGEGSHILKVRTASTTTLERLLSTIQSWRGVHGTTTSIVLSTFKESRTLAAVPVTLDAGEPVPA